MVGDEEFDQTAKMGDFGLTESAGFLPKLD